MDVLYTCGLVLLDELGVWKTGELMVLTVVSFDRPFHDERDVVEAVSMSDTGDQASLAGLENVKADCTGAG